jgi:hypothetical protein
VDSSTPDGTTNVAIGAPGSAAPEPPPSARATADDKALMAETRGAVTLTPAADGHVAGDDYQVTCRARTWRRVKCIVLPWVRLFTSVPGDLMSLKW